MSSIENWGMWKHWLITMGTVGQSCVYSLLLWGENQNPPFSVVWNPSHCSPSGCGCHPWKICWLRIFKQQSFHLWRRFAHIGKEYFFHAFFFKVSVALLFILENYASDVHAVKRKIPPLFQSRRDSRPLPHLPHLFPQHSWFLNTF